MDINYKGNHMATQIHVLELLKSKKITQVKAAEMMGLSPRQVRRKLKQYLLSSIDSLKHKSIGKPSNYRICSELEANITTILKEQYADFGPSLATEYLATNHELFFSVEFIRKTMIKAGLHKARHKTTKKEHVWRQRKLFAGEMVQLDGSYHKWIGDFYSTLLVAIDDATGIIDAHFAPESTKGVCEFIYNYFLKHGIPKSFYTDRGSVYKINNNNDESKPVTQFGRALKELNVDLIFAYSPQAKGRVERANRTLQDRLVKFLKSNGVTTIEEANEALKIFIPEFNKKFARQPAKSDSLFRPTNGVDLSTLLYIKSQRRLLNGRLVKYSGKTYLVDKYDQPHSVRIDSLLEIRESFDGATTIYHNNQSISFTNITNHVEYK